MDSATFDQEMKRLMNQWPNSYSEQRRKILFTALKDVSNFDFRDAVTRCLATSRAAPLLTELQEAVQVARNNYFQQKRIEEAGALGALESAAENNKTADKEFVEKCLKLLSDLQEKKITKEQFNQGCDFLDQAAKLYRKQKSTMVVPKQIAKAYKDDDEKPY